MAVDGRITIKSAPVTAAIRRVLQALPLGGDGKPLFTMVGRHVKTDVQLNFREGKSPEGVPWVPSRRVIESGGQTLRLTGKLRNSITYQADHASVEVGTNKIYGPRMHFGFDPLSWTGVAGGTPARPFLGLSEHGSDDLIDKVNDFLGKTWAH